MNAVSLQPQPQPIASVTPLPLGEVIIGLYVIHYWLLFTRVSSECNLGHLCDHAFRAIHWSMVSLTLKIIIHIHLYVVSICYLCMECKVFWYLSLMCVWLPRLSFDLSQLQATIASVQIWLKWQDHAEKLTFPISSPSFPYVILFLLPLTSLDP